MDLFFRCIRSCLNDSAGTVQEAQELKAQLRTWRMHQAARAKVTQMAAQRVGLSRTLLTQCEPVAPEPIASDALGSAKLTIATSPDRGSLAPASKVIMAAQAASAETDAFGRTGAAVPGGCRCRSDEIPACSAGSEMTSAQGTRRNVQRAPTQAVVNDDAGLRVYQAVTREHRLLQYVASL
jgi:hypothetical protein